MERKVEEEGEEEEGNYCCWSVSLIFSLKRDTDGRRRRKVRADPGAASGRGGKGMTTTIWVTLPSGDHK